MEFTPTGFIGLLDAKEEIWELHYPGELNELIPLSDRQAVKEMNLRVNAHRKEAEKMLADALVSNRLVGEFEYPQGSANYRCVPKWYWLNKRLTTITMGSGRMELREQIIKGWADFHLAPCFIRKSAFEAWLGITGRGRKTESKSDRGKILD